MGFDDIFQDIGGIGLYQVGLYLLLGLSTFYGGYQSMAMTFMAPKQDHWCRINRLENLTLQQQKYISIPYNEEKGTYDQCHYYQLPYNELSDTDLAKWNWTTYNGSSLPVTNGCKAWTFDQSEYSFTATSKYLLVCDRTYLISLVYCSFTVSIIIANLVAGPISDRFGRKTLLIVSICFEGLLGVLAAYAPNYPSFLVLRFLTALSIALATTCCFVLTMEFFGPQYRTIAGGLYWLFWSFGFLTLPCVALFIRNFQKLQLALAIPMFITLCYFFTVSESPRWLISQNKIAKARNVIEIIARKNRKRVPENINQFLLHNSSKDTAVSSEDDKTKAIVIDNDASGDIRTEKKTHFNLLDILKTKVLRNRILFIMPGWISCTLVYYGMSFNTGSMVGNVYRNTFLSGLVEVPAHIVCLPIMYKLGRRYSQIGTLIVSGAACLICIPFLNSGDPVYDAIVLTFMMIGKAAITMAFAVIFVYTAELFPTPVRHQAVAIPYMTGNIFGLASPFMGSFMMDVWMPLPLVIFGTIGILSGLLVFMLPETRDMQLPDNINDIQTQTHTRQPGLLETQNNDEQIRVSEEESKGIFQLEQSTRDNGVSTERAAVKYQPLEDKENINGEQASEVVIEKQL